MSTPTFASIAKAAPQSPPINQDKIRLKDSKTMANLEGPRPVSSMSSTGSATSGDSGFSCGGGESPVNFICGDPSKCIPFSLKIQVYSFSDTPPASSPLPLAEHTLLLSSAVAAASPLPANNKSTLITDPSNNFLSDFISDTFSSINQNNADNNESERKSLFKSPVKSTIVNSNSSPCLLLANSAGQNSKKPEANSFAAALLFNNDLGRREFGSGTGLPYLLSYPAFAQQLMHSTALVQQSNGSVPIKSSFPDFTQYINPDIHKYTFFFHAYILFVRGVLVTA